MSSQPRLAVAWPWLVACLASGVVASVAAQTPPVGLSTGMAQPSGTAAKPLKLSALTLGQALDAALNNDDMAVARSTVAAALGDVVSADRDPFPTVSARLSQIDLQNGVGDGNPLTQWRVDKSLGLDWTWERGNKRALRTKTAQRNAQAAQGDLEETQIQQLLAATNAFYDLAAAQERVAQIQANADGTAQIAVSAAKRVNAGDLARQDALRLEIEAERAKGDVLQVSMDRRRAALALALVLDLDAHDQSVAVQVKWPAPDGARNGADSSDSALRALVDTRADVRAAQERLAAAEAGIEGASAQKKADVTWGVSYDHFPGTSTALVELRMQMPLQFGYQFKGEITRALALREAAEGGLDKTRRAAGLELQGLRAQLQSTLLRSQGYERDILPRAKQVADQAEFAYAKGALTLNDLLDARRTLRATGLDALAARADYAKTATAWRLRTQPFAVLLNELNQTN